MPIVLVQRGAESLHWEQRYAFQCRRSHPLAGFFLVGLLTTLLAGCAFDGNGDPHSCAIHPYHTTHRDGTVRSISRSSIPSALLKPQPPPDCESSGQPEPGEAGPNAELAQRIRGDYDLACYKRAEALARERLRQLQIFVAKDAKRLSDLRPSVASP